MDTLFYSLALVWLAIDFIFSAFVLVLSVIQLIRIDRTSSERFHRFLFVVTQMLQAAVMLAVAIFLFRLLQADTVSTWFIAMLAGLLSLAATFLRRYHQSQAPI